MSDNKKYILRRLLAFFIDMAILACLLIMIYPTSGSVGSGLGGMTSTLIVSPIFTLSEYIHLNAFIAFVVWILYSILFESLFLSSIGKYLMQLQFQNLGDNLLQRIIMSTARNLLRVIPFNLLSGVYGEKILNDRILGCQLVLKENRLSKIELKLSFENSLKLLFIVSIIAVLISMPGVANYDNELKKNSILVFSRYIGLIVFGLLSYRLFITGERHLAIVYAILVIIYQPFLIINMHSCSSLRDVMVSIGLCISMLNFPGKKILENWLKIPSKTTV